MICDGGYLRWPILICPYKGASVASQQGYYSANLESVRKDVECVFVILKKRWKILEYGIRFRSMKVAETEKIFVVSCMLHNMMLSEMETRDSNYPVGRGTPTAADAHAGDAIWMGAQAAPPRMRRSDGPGAYTLANQWGKRRADLAAHHAHCKRAEKRRRRAR